MRKLAMLAIAPLVLLSLAACPPPQADDLGLAPGESAVLLRLPDGGLRWVGEVVTRGDRGLETGPRLTFGQTAEPDGECHDDDQGNRHCQCDWEDDDLGSFSLCMFFAANNCEPGTFEPTGDGYTCEGTEE